MARVPKRATVNEMLESINKQWLNTKDIQVLGCVSEKKARKIKKEITRQLLEEKYFLPDGFVPSEKVVKHLNLNISYLKKIAEREN